MSLVKAQCTNCGAALEVDDSKEAAVCPFCNTPYIVEKAINNYITNVTNCIHAQNVTVVGGKDFNQLLQTAKTLLGVSHKQGLEACNEALSLQPTNYEVWALIAKYAINDFGNVDQAIEKINELTPDEKIAEVSKDVINYLVDFRKRVPPTDPYTELGSYYLAFTKLDAEDAVIFATEILDLMVKKLTFLKSIKSYVDIFNAIVIRRKQAFEICSQNFKNTFERRDEIISARGFGNLCVGNERNLLEYANCYATLYYCGKAVTAAGGLFSPSSPGLLKLTNYNISFETNKSKNCFSKTLESLESVYLCPNPNLFRLKFSDGYEVGIFPQPSRNQGSVVKMINETLVL